MSIETLVIAIAVFAIVWVLIQYVVPEPPQRIAFIILYCAAALWVLTHLRQLLHLQVG